MSEAEDRYEIRNKLRQGELGTVYRARDNQFNKDVALFRILPEDSGAHEQNEAISEMEHYCKVLHEIQHPNILNIFDAGVDADGPFIVTEYCKGQSVRDSINTEQLSQKDFIEFAEDTLQGLHAIHSANLLHKNLKPTNIIFAELPSGTLQAKLTDLGLSQFQIHKPASSFEDRSPRRIQHFTAPEIFEGKEHSQSSDLYALGCVFYYTLTGWYPFHHETEAEIQKAHLDNDIQNVSEARTGCPQWLNDWVMQHIKVNPSDRPSNALQSLESLAKGPSRPAPATVSSKFIIPPASNPNKQSDTETTSAVDTPTRSPQAVVVPSAEQIEKPSPTATQGLSSVAPLTPKLTLGGSINEEGEPSSAQPNKAQPKKTTLLSGGSAQGTPTSSLSAPEEPAPEEAAEETPPPVAKVKKPMNKSAKIALFSCLGAGIIIAGAVLASSASNNKFQKELNALIMQTSDQDPSHREPTTKAQLMTLMERMITLGADDLRDAVQQRVMLAEGTDCNVDDEVVQFATTQTMLPSLQKRFFDIIDSRSEPKVAGDVLQYVAANMEHENAPYALNSIRKSVRDKHFSPTLQILIDAPNDEIKRNAEKLISRIGKKTKRSEKLSNDIITAYQRTDDENKKLALLRLLGSTGGSNAVKVIKDVLSTGTPSDQLAAINALKNWKNDDMFEALLESMGLSMDKLIRKKSFEAALNFLSQNRERPDEKTKEMWEKLKKLAESPEERLGIINTSARALRSPWVKEFLSSYLTDDNEQVKDRADRALEFIANRK